MEPLVRVDGVSKRFLRRDPLSGKADVRALSDVSFAIPAGGAVAVMGANGSGKSTLARVLAGLVEPDAGEVRVAGRRIASPADAAGLTGFAGGDERSLFLRLSVRENLRHAAGLRGIAGDDFTRRLEAVSGDLDLGPFLEKRAADLSTGQKQAVILARALLADPPVLVLDEPTRSLDDGRKRAAWAALARLEGEGKALFVATHDPEEARALGATVLHLEGGRVGASDPAPARTPVATRAATRDGVFPLASLRAGLRRAVLEEGGAWISNGFWLLGLAAELAGLFFLGRMMGFAAPAALAPYGGSYFPFVLVWFLFQGVQGAALHRFAAETRAAQLSGTLEATVSGAGDPRWALLAGTVWGILKGLIVAALGLAVWGACRGGWSPAGVCLAALAAALSSVALLGVGFAAAGLVLAFQRGNALPSVFGAVAPLLAGGLYPPEVLPAGLRALAEWIPQTPALRLARRGLLAGEWPPDAGRDLAVLFLFAAAFLAAGLWAFGRGFRAARRRGVLARY